MFKIYVLGSHTEVSSLPHPYKAATQKMTVSANGCESTQKCEELKSLSAGCRMGGSSQPEPLCSLESYGQGFPDSHPEAEPEALVSLG